jgi:glycosyltransferase involved in cell wall biosynthesis
MSESGGLHGAEWAAVVPAYNSRETIRICVESAWTAGASEVIVVDDGSTDDTSELARIAGAAVYRQANQGAASARRLGIAQASSSMIVLLDADDTLVASGVAASVRLLASVPEASVAVGLARGVLLNGKERLNNVWPEGVNLDSLLARGHAPGPPSAFVWRADALRRVIEAHPVPLWPRYAEDYEFILRGALLGGVITHENVSTIYAWSGGKSSKAPLRSVTSADDIRQHYAAMLGIEIAPRGRQELRSMALMRRASEASGVARFGLLSMAALFAPSATVRRLRRKLQLLTRK